MIGEVVKIVDSPEKAAERMLGGMKCDDLDEKFAAAYCRPKLVGCDREEYLNSMDYQPPCKECVLKWLKEEH